MLILSKVPYGFFFNLLGKHSRLENKQAGQFNYDLMTSHMLLLKPLKLKLSVNKKISCKKETFIINVVKSDGQTVQFLY